MDTQPELDDVRIAHVTLLPHKTINMAASGSRVGSRWRDSEVVCLIKNPPFLTARACILGSLEKAGLRTESRPL